ncbi:MAG TPA: hypothetical protein VFC65_04940 [Prolixibacteraceae bacterium]|nr:hypothetical protein [Prolixibacteraceae bacterium]
MAAIIGALFENYIVIDNAQLTIFNFLISIDMAQKKVVNFTDENIRKIFGSYDGEGENIDRLKEYYFKTETYSKIISDLPIKILVGHKGIGKSALFRIAMSEQKDSGNLPILIKPDDIGEIGEKHESLILSIRKWKFGLTDIIAKKVLSEFGIIDEGITARIIKVGGRIIPLITKSVIQQKDNSDITQSQKLLIEKFLTSNKIDVYLDDLDRGWQNRKEGLIMISALINSIRDLSSENPGLIFKLALRSDVFNAVRIEDESSDKYEGGVVWHSYELHEIFVMLIKRLLTFWGESINEENLLKTSQRHIAFNLDSIFENTFFGTGKWEKAPMYKVILSLIRNRPRDLVKLCTMAARQAYRVNSTIIKSSHILSILPDYSKSIIKDTIAEYKSELPQIERLIYGMKPSKKERFAVDSFVFSTSELHKKIFNITQRGQFIFANGKVGDAHDISRFLYKINFLTARKTLEDGTIERKSYEHDSNLSSSYMDFGYDWEVHLAYRWDLQADSLIDIFSKHKL